MGFLKCLRFRIRRKKGPGKSDKCSGNSKTVDGLVCNGDQVKHGSVRRFTWDDIERLTRNFSRVIGSGGFSTVYLGQFSDSSLGAIKIHSSSSERLSRVYRQELEILLQLRHDNIVKFLGYCDDREEGALVFECVPSGNLQEKLHGGGEGFGSVLSWKNRMAIAFQLAQAIEYLHEKCSLQIVHGDIKSSNILLDEQLNCKLCDFGSAKMGFSSTVLPSSSPRFARHQLMMGSPGYVDPHYLRTGLASKKNDVYSFGVVVLELITGKEAFCPEKGPMLTSIACTLTSDQDPDAIKMSEMVDPRLHGDFNLEEARVMASIARLCLHQTPSLRPSAADILLLMKEKVDCVSCLFSMEKRFK